jgi:hypothetical protein
VRKIHFLLFAFFLLLHGGGAAKADDDLVVTAAPEDSPVEQAAFARAQENENENENEDEGEQELPKKKREKLFDSSRPLKLEISGEFKQMRKENPAGQMVKKDKGYEAVILTGAERIPVSLIPRGNYRWADCVDVPPFKVELIKGAKGDVFHGIDRDIKFVSHCMNSSVSFQNRVLNEYTAFKILEAAGFPAFQVRLVDGIYKDENGKEIGRGPGFFIENIKDYAKRRGLTPESQPRASEERMSARLHLAEALLINADFQERVTDPFKSETVQHNVRFVRNGKNEVLEMVPYDFDLSRLVRNKPRLKGEAQEKVQELSALKGMAEEFQALLAKQDAIYKAIDEGPSPPAEKRAMKEKIGEFLDAIKKEAKRR